MARKGLMQKEIKREKLVAKYLKIRLELKEQGNYEALQGLPRNSSPARLVNRCGVTGRPRGYMRRFGISRIVFREKALLGEIPGVRKISW